MTTERWKGYRWKGDSHLLYVCGHVAVLEFYVHLWLCCNTGVTDICRCVAVLELCTYVAVLQYWNYWPCGKNRESAADS